MQETRHGAVVPTVRVVAAAIVVGECVLIQQRPPGGRRAGLWEFPGGKVEPGESDEAALVRECHEELGVRIIVGEPLWQGQHRYGDLEVALHVYRAVLAPGVEPQSCEGQPLAWSQRTELAAFDFCPADRALVEALVAGSLDL
ncbi:MAG: (deoxy)nucleoside triphosphate pyrophosphohydrolase [Myxococcota bacterium]